MDQERTTIRRVLAHALLAAVLTAGLIGFSPGTARAAGDDTFGAGTLSSLGAPASASSGTAPDFAALAAALPAQPSRVVRPGLSATSTDSPPETGTITGRVTGPTGKPLADAWIGAFSRSSKRWIQFIGTDADGNYALADIAAGSYTLCFQGPTDSGLATECWSNEPFLWDEDALVRATDPIRVWPGKTVTGRNAQLEETGRITGYVTFAGQAMPEGLRVSAYLRHGGWQWATSSLIEADGKFEITDLFPGSYALQLDQCCATIEARGNASIGLAWADWRGRVLATVRPSVSGTPVVGGLLKARAGSGRFKSFGLTYQWFRDGVAIPQAIGRTYRVVGDDAGAELSVLVTSSRASDRSSQASISKPTKRVALAATPTISGIATTGATLTAVPGEWTGGTTFTYRWYANRRTIKGATGAEYVVPSSKAGTRIRVRVTGSLDDHPTVSRKSGYTGKVMRASRPVVTGTQAAGEKLSVRRGSWTRKVRFGYQWLRDGEPIEGATRSTYWLTGDDVGTGVTVRLTGTRRGYQTVVSDSEGGGRVALAGTPTATGLATVGETLTADAGLWTDGTSFAYEWFANGRLVAASSGETDYTPSAADAGKRLTVRVTGTLDGYATVSRTSPATDKVTGI